jgi:tetratricopeptide (TPR) repeat protein
MAPETTLPATLAGFFEAAPPGAQRALIALSAAESLTDETAARLYALSPIERLSAERFVQALHYSSFVGLRNSEWHIVPQAREWLNAQLGAHPELARHAHETLLALADEADPAGAGETVPSYLFTGAGRAYHKAAIDPEEGLHEYATAYRSHLTGEQWLLARLAVEQQERGILPAHAIEPAFLQGMVSYREGDFDTAQRLLSRVAASEERRQEVAIAAHLVGHMLGRRGDPREAEILFRKSLDIERELGNRHGEAQVMHSLANLIGRRRPDDAEQLYGESLDIGRELGNRHHMAQVMHSLANLIGRRRPDDAEQLYRDSLDILRELGDRHGEAQVENSLGAMYRRLERWPDARVAYEHALEISNDPRDRTIAYEGLSLVAELGWRDLDSAITHMRSALEQQRRAGGARFIRQQEKRLRKLERRQS